MSTVLVELTDGERDAAAHALRNMLSEFGGMGDWPEARAALQKLCDTEPSDRERVR